MEPFDEAERLGRELTDKMTLEEVISQLCMEAKAVERLNIPHYGWMNEALHGVARSGAATVFPQPIGLAAMFDEDRLRRMGDIIATEARAKYNMYRQYSERYSQRGLTYWSPNVNIFRDPRWGRGHETYGEDPYLTAHLGVAFVKGMQGDGKYLKAAACAKHFVAHSGPDPLRHGFDAIVSKKDLFETYLPAFEAMVKEAHVEGVMATYNRVNGIPNCANKWLLKDLLRDKWGFKGYVTSDWDSIEDMHVFHKYTHNAAESAAVGIKGGTDMNCGSMYAGLMTSYRQGLVSEEEIRAACAHDMATRYRLGMFADDCEYDSIPYEMNECRAHRREALEDARRSMVLLRNDGILPLDPKKLKRVAVIGPNADSVACLEGNYNGTASEYITFLEGIRRVLGDEVEIMHCEGCDITKEEVETDDPQVMRRSAAEPLIMARSADVVILCLGLDASIEGEAGDVSNSFAGGDKVDLELPLSQEKLLERLEATGTPVVVVLSAGSAVNVHGGRALLEAWYPGQSGGLAAAEILFGKVSPSGRLPITFYEDIKNCPDFCDYSMKNRTYRYFTGKVAYPFGFGLSYAEFRYCRPVLNGRQVCVTVKNVSDVASDEVVQLYVKVNGSRFAPNNPSLAGFKRIHLEPYTQTTVSLDIPERALMVVNEDGEYIKDGSDATVYIGGSQPDERSARLLGRAPFALRIGL